MLRVDDDNKPVLRLESREDFARIPEPLRAEICRQLNVAWNIDNFDIKIISEDEKYEQHYIRRINAVNAGAQFLLDSLLTDENREAIDNLKNTANEITRHCRDYLENLGSNDITHFQNSLSHYSDVLITTLATMLNISTHSIKEQLDRAEQFSTVSITRPAVCTISRLSGPEQIDQFIVQLDQPKNPFTPDLIAELRAIKHNADVLPEWFTCLDEADKRLLQHFLNTHTEDNYGRAINSISSKLRIIPAPANYGQHTLITFLNINDDDPHLTVHPPEFRSSHIASRDVSKMPQSVRDTHAYLNLKKEIEDAVAYQTSALLAHAKQTGQSIQKNPVMPILYQTLITPLKEPDASLHTDRTLAIAKINEHLAVMEKENEINPYLFMITSNHPLNYAKWVMPTIPGSETAESITNLIFIIRQDENLVTKDPQKKLILEEVCNALETCVNSPFSAGYTYRELYLSSIEQLLIGEFGGVSIGSCVSGKDRKAVEIAHSDALKIYFSIYHSVPPVAASTVENQAAMDEFAQIFADIYCTKHQMAIADFNAPGSFGIKTPDMYLPDHLTTAIKNWYIKHRTTNPLYDAAVSKNTLKESDIMASNNEVKHFKQRELSSNKADLSWKFTSLQIHERVPIEHYINMALIAAQNYPKTRANRIGLFARLSGSVAGECRSSVCDTLLADQELTPFQKVALIHALISSTKLGENLIADMVKMMGFKNVDTAALTLSDYLNMSGKQFGMTTTNPLVDCARAIQEQLGKLGNLDQIEACVADIKAELGKLAPQQSPTPKSK